MRCYTVTIDYISLFSLPDTGNYANQEIRS